ncbi:hypothetical protein HZC31_00715 [Candidatus Woesearchaeota archaeon]|nr:hypothetical protein [Candidatus Woesearchaeota archaeon]
MINKELADYIKRQFEHGHDSATIREHLLKHGYTETIADEALHDVHPPEKPHIKGLKYLPFSGKKMTIAFLALFALGGIGFALMNLLGSGDLAGAATEPTDFPDEIGQEITQEQPEEEQPAEEISEEPVLPEEEIIEEVPEEEPVEETTEEVVEEEPATEEEEEVAVSGCTGDSSCDTGYVCYEQGCSVDNDRDLLSDAQEESEGTDSLDQDSDDDGYFDSQELDDGSDPLDATSPGYTTCSSTSDCAAGSTCSEDGICVACEDSDALNYKKKGTTQGVHYTVGKAILAQDNCQDESTLMEYYCRDGSAFYFEQVSCEEEYGTGYSCSNGKCVS